MTRDQIIAAIAAEVDRAYSKHGRGQWGRHEFYAILLEEVDEAWGDIKTDAPIDGLEKEIIQIAAVCVRYLETGDRYGWVAKSACPTHRQPLDDQGVCQRCENHWLDTPAPEGAA